MNYVKISGGLGNQLFQTALANTISLNYPVTVDVSDYRKFDIHEGFLVKNLLSENVKIVDDYSNSYIINFIGKLLARGISLPYCKHDYKNKLINTSKIGKNNYWLGTFQSTKYFEKNESEIKANFLEFIIKNKSKELYDKITSKSALIHIRLGDYNTGRYKKLLGGHTESNYLNEALKYASSLGIKKFKVISNGSVEFLLKNREFDIEFEIIDDGSLSAFDCLYLIINADFFIGWNSSLSWWGAYLRNNKQKTVLPKKWFFLDDWHGIIDESNLITYI